MEEAATELIMAVKTSGNAADGPQMPELVKARAGLKRVRCVQGRPKMKQRGRNGIPRVKFPAAPAALWGLEAERYGNFCRIEPNSILRAETLASKIKRGAPVFLLQSPIRFGQFARGFPG